MQRSRVLRLFALGWYLLIPCLALARTDRTFTTSTEASLEARSLVRLLEEFHYNRDAVKTRDYAEIVSDYMSELDNQRLFFLASDKAAFSSRYDKSLYWNISQLGNIDAAYEIFNVYAARAESRVNWISAELKKDFDFTTHETYQLDRSRAEWPATQADADDLWRRHLKSELIAEMLNKKTVDQAKDIVRKRYEHMLKNLDDIDANQLAEIFLTCITGLYDPHSTYFSADDYEDFSIQMRLSLVGIGALLDAEDDYCVIKELVPGGPADLSKQLHPNDKIISVAQAGAEPVDVIGMKLHRIVNLIRGAKGTKVRLTIIPADAADPSARKEITLTRDVVQLNSARAHAAIFDVPSADGKSTTPIGVISLPNFYGPTDDSDSDGEKTSASKDVASLIKQLQTAGIKGIVLDLRHNGGGLLSEAVDIVGLFISQGPVVQVKDYQGDIKLDSDTDPSVAYAGPLAVLVDRFSASASEIVAGALQDYGRAIIIGDSSTHGKGTVQTIVDMKTVIPQLADSPVKTGATKITIQKFYLPDGSSTQLKGVVPDIILPSIDDYLPNIGEKELPHALVWDEIPTSFFDGARLDAKSLQSLRDDSLARQQKLEEFSYLKNGIDWIKTIQAQKSISLNLDDRRKEKTVDNAFRKKMDAEKDRLAKNDFKYREFWLSPPPPKPALAKKSTDKNDDDMDDNGDSDIDENQAYMPVDIPLRESLRVVNDAVALDKNQQFWVNHHAPLTAVVAVNKS